MIHLQQCRRSNSFLLQYLRHHTEEDLRTGRHHEKSRKSQHVRKRFDAKFHRFKLKIQVEVFSRIIRWSFEKRRRILRRLHTNLRHLLEKVEYVWIVYLQPVAYKLFAFFCVVCSAVLLWTEVRFSRNIRCRHEQVFFTVPKPDLSVFSLLISDHGRPYLFQVKFE